VREDARRACAAATIATVVVLARNSAPERRREIADSAHADIRRRYQSLRSPAIALCPGNAHPVTSLLTEVACPPTAHVGVWKHPDRAPRSLLAFDRYSSAKSILRRPSRNRGPSRQPSTTFGPGMSVWPLGWPGAECGCVVCRPRGGRKRHRQGTRLPRASRHVDHPRSQGEDWSLASAGGPRHHRMPSRRCAGRKETPL